MTSRLKGSAVAADPPSVARNVEKAAVAGKTAVAGAERNVEKAAVIAKPPVPGSGKVDRGPGGAKPPATPKAAQTPVQTSKGPPPAKPPVPGPGRSADKG